MKPILGPIIARKLSEDSDIDRGTGQVPCSGRAGDVAFFTPSGWFVGLVPAHYSTCPTRRNRYQMLNCVRYLIEWGPDYPSK